MIMTLNMKTISAAVGLALLLAASGCSTSKSVSQMQGQGIKQTYNVSFDPVWRAAVDAVQIGDLRVLNADRQTGYIAARRGMRPESFGENVGLWVTRVSPTQTQVEVVSRQAGPPKFAIKNWQKDILRSIDANLTREAPAAGATGAGSSTEGAGQNK